MAGIDLANTFMGTLPTAGGHFQMGEFTNSGDGTVFVPTTFTNKVVGLAYGDLTDSMGGYANSICEGPTIKFSMADSTGSAGITYIAFGW
jgi:hypothetical protein